MALSFKSKQAITKELAEIANSSTAAVGFDYSGMNVAELTELRSFARESGVRLRVTKNTLAKRALQKTYFDCILEGLKGPIMLAFSGKEANSAAKVIHAFSKQNPKLIPKLVAFEGQSLLPSSIEVLASLPSKEEAISILMSVIIAPVTTLARIIKEPQAKLVRTIAMIPDKK